MDGGDRQTLTPSGHYVTGCTSHHNQRWIMNYAPDVMLAGVGATITDTEIYGSPQIAVFFQGNDHSLTGGSVHDAGRQCSDCGAFYMGREWTYRGNSITGVTFANLSSIFGKAHGEPSAVYLDDQLSSVTVDSCTFIQVEGCVMLLGGGRDNHFTNNSKHTSNLPLHICCISAAASTSDPRSAVAYLRVGPRRNPWVYVDGIACGYSRGAVRRHTTLLQYIHKQSAALLAIYGPLLTDCLWLQWEIAAAKGRAAASLSVSDHLQHFIVRFRLISRAFLTLKMLHVLQGSHTAS